MRAKMLSRENRKPTQVSFKKHLYISGSTILKCMITECGVVESVNSIRFYFTLNCISVVRRIVANLKRRQMQSSQSPRSMWKHWNCSVSVRTKYYFI